MTSALTLIADAAADYVGSRSAAQFRREVAAGVWPQPITKGSRPERWSAYQLDEALRGGTKAKDSAVAELDMALGLR